MALQELRNMLGWQGRVYEECGMGPLFFENTSHGRRLAEKYSLRRWERAWNESTWHSVLPLLDILDRIPSWLIPGIGLRLDVDVGDWRHAGALAAWLDHHRDQRIPMEVIGLDPDPLSLGMDLTTRNSRARFFSESCQMEEMIFSYQQGSAKEWNREVSLVSWFYPDPSAAGILNLARCLSRGGLMIILNRNTWEWEVTKGLFNRAIPALRPAKPGLLLQEEIMDASHPGQSLFLSCWTVT